MRTAVAALLAGLLGCGGPDAPARDPAPDAGPDVAMQPDATLEPERCRAELTLVPPFVEASGAGDCSITLAPTADTLVEVVLEGAQPSWLAPEVWTEPRTIDLVADGEWTLVAHDHGPPVDEILRERSLVWTNPVIVDDPDVVGLRRVMQAASGAANPGASFAGWLNRFASTSHSERVGPAQFLDELRAEFGDDPAAWDLDALPFTVTAVHNRVDLADGSSCGELRVSLASTHTIFQPFHAIFLFAQSPGAGDVSPDGVVHCGATERRWARLSALGDAEFVAAARDLLDEALVSERFLMIETVEFIISPWEWRQWLPGADGFDNPPLFQTVDTTRLNAPGLLRDRFLDFVGANAAALDARTLLIPDEFRPRSARVNSGVPWIPLDLDGVNPDALVEYPNLRGNLEIVGCPACHATDADFVQTRPDRTFSPFYDKELDARGDYLRAVHRGEPRDAPFGPLQPAPALPP